MPSLEGEQQVAHHWQQVPPPPPHTHTTSDTTTELHLIDSSGCDRLALPAVQMCCYGVWIDVCMPAERVGERYLPGNYVQQRSHCLHGQLSLHWLLCCCWPHEINDAYSGTTCCVGSCSLPSADGWASLLQLDLHGNFLEGKLPDTWGQKLQQVR